MSVLGDLAAKRFWSCVLLTAIIVLAVTAVGALVTVAGIVPAEKAWMAGCVAWLLGGWLGGRFAAQGKEQQLVRSVLNMAVTASLFWGAGLTTPNASGFTERGWLWYLGWGLLGAVAAAVIPQKKKRRRRGKRGK